MKMSGRPLLDTNIVIALFRNEIDVRNRIAASPEVFIPAIVIGELYFGAMHSAHSQQNITRLREFVTTVSALPCDASTGEHFGRIKNELKGKGRPIPENDIWIAAVARQHDLTIVTRDQHFNEIDGVQLEEW